MLPPNRTDEGSLFAAWREQFSHARANPFLLQLLLKQYQRVLKRLAYFYAQLAMLPRRNRRALQRALATSLIGAAMLLALSSAPIVHANAITVSGACSLAEAIGNANDTTTGQPFPDCAAGNPAGADTIYLTADVTLGAALPTITSEITLEGGNFFVSGTNTFRVFEVRSSGDFTINDTTVKQGRSGTFGGGIYSYQGSVTLNDSIVSGNYAGFNGGGIFNYAGSVTLNDTDVIRNSVAIRGGGIYSSYGSVTLNASSIAYNNALVGAGVWNANSSTLKVIDSTINDNVGLTNGAADPAAGGIYNYRANATLENTTISGNSAHNASAILNSTDGTMEMTNTTISRNDSANDGGSGGTSTIVNVYSMTINNSTISENSAGGVCAVGIESFGTLDLNRSLITGNSNAGCAIIANKPSGTVTADNYNLFGHSGMTNAQAFSGFTPGASDFNATSDGDGTSTHVPTALSAIVSPLAPNGGPTETNALPAGSPALDKAPNADCSASPIDGVDQRGFTRNVHINGGNPNNLCDIGAFELQAPTATNETGVKGLVNKNGNIVLRWKTTSELQIAGFNIYRQGKQGAWKQINAKFRQAKHAGAPLGDKYRYIDRQAKTDKTHRYKIEIVYLDGHTEWTNVIRVNVK